MSVPPYVPQKDNVLGLPLKKSVGGSPMGACCCISCGRFGINSSLNNSSTPFSSDFFPSVGTLECWVKNIGNGNNNWFYCRVGGSPASGYRLGISGGVVSVYCVFGVSGDVSTLSSGRLLADGNFHHVAFTWDGVYGKLWIDGALDTVFAAVGVPIPAADLSNLYLGLGGDEVHLDEFRISNIVRYTTSFTPSKCNQLDANTIALWHCDEGSGLSIADATGNHNATFDPASDWVVGVF